MINDEVRRKLRLVARIAVASRRARGKDDDTIRREATAVAVEALREHLADEREHKAGVAVVQRAVDEAIAGGTGDVDFRIMGGVG